MKESSNVEKLKTARSLNEVLSVVDVIKKKISNIGKSTPQLLKALSSTNKITISLSATDEVELSDLKKKRTKKTPKSLRTVLDKNFKAPSQKEMAENTSAIEELNSSISELEVAIRVLSSKTFSKFDDSKQAIQTIKSIIKQAASVRDSQLSALNKVSKKFIPKEHKSVVQAAKKIIERDINPETYTSLSVKSYTIAPAQDTIYFQTFILVRNLTNREGFTYNAYSYVITSVFDQKTNELTPHLTALKDPRIPGSFPIGSEVETSSMLTNKINGYNSLDDIDIVQNKFKFNRRTDELKAPMKNLNKHIKNIRVKDRQLYIKISNGLSEKQVDNLRDTLIAYIRSIFLPRSRKSVVWKRVKGKTSGSNFLVFALNTSTDTRPKEFIRKVNQFSQELGLSPRLTRDIVENLANQL